MEIFRDQTTGLIFPARVGSWARYDITTYPLATAGYSVIYQLRGWLGGLKASLSVDVYNKGLPHIPPGPRSPCVAIELQNIMHAMVPAAFAAVDASRTDAYLNGSANADRELPGNIDSAGVFRLNNGETQVAGNRAHVVVYLTAHRDHFIKLMAFDMNSLGSLDAIRDFAGNLAQLIKAIPDLEVTAETLWAVAILGECASAEVILDEALKPSRAAERPLILAALQSLLAHAAWRALTVAMPNDAFSVCSALCEILAGRSSLPQGHFPNVWAVVFQLLTQQPTTAKNAESLWARIAFALGDAGYDAPHVYDWLWVNYTVLVYPNFNIRVFEAAGGRDGQLKPSPKESASALATANGEFHKKLRSLAEKVMGDNIVNAEFRRECGAVVMETNLRQIQRIEK